MTIRTVKKKPIRVHKTASSAPAANTKQLKPAPPVPTGPAFEGKQDAGGASLTVECADQDPVRVALLLGEYLIGRDPACNVRIPLSNVSRRHARVFREGEDFVIEDLESTNGTYVNSVPVSRCVLHAGDRIRIGEAKLVFARDNAGR